MRNVLALLIALFTVGCDPIIGSIENQSAEPLRIEIYAAGQPRPLITTLQPKERLAFREHMNFERIIVSDGKRMIYERSDLETLATPLLESPGAISWIVRPSGLEPVGAR
jgi:hypothetical protein